MPSVLFVCTVNRCRSPMAMALCEAVVRRRFPGENWRIESAGTWTEGGLLVLQVVQRYLAARGLDASRHRSRPVSAPLLHSFQLILTMEQGQKEALQIEFPEVAGRVFLLSEMSGSESDVIDPPARSYKEMVALGNELDKLIKRGLDRIAVLAHEGETPVQPS